MTVQEALEHSWLAGAATGLDRRIPSSKYEEMAKKLRQRLVSTHCGSTNLRVYKYLHYIVLIVIKICILYEQGEAALPIGHLSNYSSLMRLDAKRFALHDADFDRREAAPRFVRKPKSANVKEGGNGNFVCRVVAPPIFPPTVTWLKDDSPLSQSVKYMQKYAYASGTFELRINRVKLEDKGVIRDCSLSHNVTMSVWCMCTRPFVWLRVKASTVWRRRTRGDARASRL